MNDFRFAASRFDDPAKMMRDLREKGFHISLWQLPYFAPGNRLFDEIISKGYAITDAKGNVPNEDAIIDFSNPDAVGWYKGHMKNLLELGVGAIKVDFGEAGPLVGLYASGRTGFYEHNLYPLRYNKSVADITVDVRGENIIWARSAWAGSQRYPVHWGGDVANSSVGMASTLRGGLSFGISGFTFWSHDIGGFPTETPEELYRRWLPFGMLASHSRTHGHPPKEPWYYGEDFTNAFRNSVELKYKLMPYVYAQAKHSSENGLPMVRALFIEYPDDPGSWLIEDQYLFGSDIMVAPLFEENTTGRNIYLPPGMWIDYQTGEVYQGGWHRIEAGALPVVMLVRDGAVIPHASTAQSTNDIDWSELDLIIFTDVADRVSGKICLPEDNVLKTIVLDGTNGMFSPTEDPFEGRIKYTILMYTDL
jgi:alpha-D-xyloside xylohydrolase